MGHRIPETVNRYNDNLATIASHRRDESHLTGQKTELPKESSRAVDSEQVLARAAVALDDSYRARLDGDEIARPVTFPEQQLPRSCGATLPIAREKLHLSRAEAGIGPIHVGRLGRSLVYGACCRRG